MAWRSKIWSEIRALGTGLQPLCSEKRAVLPAFYISQVVCENSMKSTCFLFCLQYATLWHRSCVRQGTGNLFCFAGVRGPVDLLPEVFLKSLSSFGPVPTWMSNVSSALKGNISKELSLSSSSTISTHVLLPSVLTPAWTSAGQWEMQRAAPPRGCSHATARRWHGCERSACPTDLLRSVHLRFRIVLVCAKSQVWALWLSFRASAFPTGGVLQAEHWDLIWLVLEHWLRLGYNQMN